MDLIVLLALFVPIVLINAIVGLVRGLNKSVVRLMFIVAAALLTYLIAGPIATAVANSITVEGRPLGNLLMEALAFENGNTAAIFAAAPLLQELVMVLPAFIIGIVMFPVVFYTLKFITWIVFLFVQKPLRKLIFKDSCDKEEYKAQPKNKRLINRFSGLGVGIVTGMIIFGMLLTPFLGVFGMLPDTDSMDDMLTYMVEFGEMTPDDANMVREVYASTDAGIIKFYGVLGGRGLGKLYINSVTKVEADGISTTLGNELESIMSLLKTMLQSGMLNDSDPNAIYSLLADKEKLDSLMQEMFNSKILCAAIPDLMATVMGEVAGSMKVPADKNAVYDNMMEEVALAVRTADVDFAAIAAYEAVNGKGYDLLPIAYYSNLSAGELLTKEEYEAQIDQLVELAKKISSVFNKSLSGDNKAFTDGVAVHIIENVKTGGQDAAATLDAQAVAGVISGIDSTTLEGDADKLLSQLTDKEKFETDVVTVDMIADAIRETVRAAVADESKAKETASTLASVVSDFAGAVSNATDAEGNLDMTKLDFTKIGDAITTLQNSPLKGVGTCVLDMVAAADAGGMLGNVMQAVKDGYEKGEDVGGTIGSAGALIGLGNAMGGEDNQEAMVNSLTDLIKNLNEFTISLLPTIFSEDTVTSMGIPAEYADATYKVFETLLTELMKLKDAADYDNEVNAILELYNLATSGTDNFTEENLKNLFGYANKSDAIYNTLVGISTSDPFGMKIEDPAARQELANAIAEVYADTAKTAKDQSIARAIAALLGVDKELKLG